LRTWGQVQCPYVWGVSDYRQQDHHQQGNKAIVQRQYHDENSFQ
jgi:hypothetical protein